MLKKITTSTGFTCTINDKIGEDIELVDMLAELDEGNVLMVPKILKKIMSAEDKNRLYDKIRAEDGRVPPEEFGVELKAIFDAAGKETKK